MGRYLNPDEKRGWPRFLITSLICLLFLCIFTGCTADSGASIKSFSDLEKPGTKIAVSSGCPEEALANKKYTQAEIISYSQMNPAYSELTNGKLDACIYARKEMALAIDNGVSGARLLDDNFCMNTVAIGLSRKSHIPDLKEKIDEFIRELKDNGTLDDMYDRWVNKNDETMPDIEEPDHPSDTLIVATTGTVMPYSYFAGAELNGYDIELAKRFAAWLGMGLEFRVIDFGGIIAAAQAGKADCVMSNLFYTPEHAEAIDFSDPLLEVEVTAMVRDTGAVSAASFADYFADGFEKTFIREDRWQLFLTGICTTLLITVAAILFGSLLGFNIYMLCRNGNRAANRITGLFVRLVQGLPVVVFLMILYYIIFRRVQISALIVSIIGFSLIFTAAVFSMLKNAVSAVDRGQAEAAYALGYSNRRAFFRVVLPQAMPFFMPAFLEQITALIKATAIVGYITVQDLTKVADIIRGRTYDAFFPLIASAVIYFVMAFVLTAIVKRIGRRFEPEKRKRIGMLKGVKMHD